jgi:hypothetical protein
MIADQQAAFVALDGPGLCLVVEKQRSTIITTR